MISYLLASTLAFSSLQATTDALDLVYVMPSDILHIRDVKRLDTSFYVWIQDYENYAEGVFECWIDDEYFYPVLYPTRIVKHARKLTYNEAKAIFPGITEGRYKVNFFMD